MGLGPKCGTEEGMWFLQIRYPTGCQKCQKPRKHPLALPHIEISRTQICLGHMLV